MIEYLILLLLAKSRDELTCAPAERDPLDRCLDVGAGLDWNPPEPKRPDLRLVK